MNIPDDLGRVALGAAAAALIGAMLVGLFFFVMFGFDSSALAIGARALLATGPAALLIGVPLYLFVRRVSHGFAGLIATGVIAGAVWALLSSQGSTDPGLYGSAALLGGVSAMIAQPIVRRRGRLVRSHELNR